MTCNNYSIQLLHKKIIQQHISQILLTIYLHNENIDIFARALWDPSQVNSNFESEFDTEFPTFQWDDFFDDFPIITTHDDDDILMMYPDDNDNEYNAVHDHEEPDDETHEVDYMDAMLGLSLRSCRSMDPSIPSTQNVTGCN